MLNILIVDDDYRDRQGVARVIALQKWPVYCAEAENGKAALKILETVNIDIMITDIRMPDMLGTDLAERACEINPDMKIILVSAYKEFNYAIKAIHFGAVNYLLKPYTVTDLIETVKTAVNLCMKDKSAENSPAEQNQILFKLVNGILPENQLKTANAILRPDRENLRIAFFSILPEAFENAEKTKLFTAEIFGNSSITLTLKKNNYIVFFRDTSVIKNTEKIKQIFDECKRELHIIMGIIYSRPISDVSLIHKSFASIKQMEEIFFFTSESFVLEYEDRTETENIPTECTVELNDSIETHLLSQNYDAALKVITDFFNNLEKSNHFSSIYVKYLATETVKKIFYISDTDNTEKNIRQWIEEIFSTASIYEINDIFKSIIEEIRINHSENAISFIIDKVFLIIKNEYRSNPSLESIAERLYISPSYLSRLFKEKTGQNFMNYIKRYRMDKACELLKNTNMRVSQICREIGYDSTSYFCSLFKTTYGITPKQYREGGSKGNA